MPDEFDLQRFLDVQQRVYRDVVAELGAGRKRTHWMWFIFPQIAGLGLSSTSVFFAISSLAEARAYADHAVLGVRLRECVGLMLAHKSRSALEILGPVDAVKFRSSMTLFAAALPAEEAFGAALESFFAGEADPETLKRLL